MADTRTDIIDLAEQLIRTKGYNAFSYKDISDELGIKNAAIHYHFPSKADLGQAMINRTRERFIDDTASWLDLTPKKQLKAFIDVYQNSSQKNLVCFMGALGPAFKTLPLIMQKELTEAGADIRGWLRQVLSTGKRTGEFNFTETVSEKSDLIISSLLSSLIIRRISGDDVLSSVSKAILKGV